MALRRGEGDDMLWGEGGETTAIPARRRGPAPDFTEAVCPPRCGPGDCVVLGRRGGGTVEVPVPRGVRPGDAFVVTLPPDPGEGNHPPPCRDPGPGSPGSRTWILSRV